ncbi:MAG: hypothetical protein JXB10_06035 [Pirellulales bacterium]|nr:hypothetical protein [Pirellulales bacterium]
MPDTLAFEAGPWRGWCDQQGGRIGRLCYDGLDLLTGPPLQFNPPSVDYGLYETRPVFGYDDCFPSVAVGDYPGLDRHSIPDHGELCWLPWEIQFSPDRLVGTVASRQLPVRFRRTLHFSAHRVEWLFDVHNDSPHHLPFLHVMHPLMPPDHIQSLVLPSYQTLYDDIAHNPLPHQSPEALGCQLASSRQGEKKMLFLQGLQSGYFEIRFRREYALGVHFDVGIFPTLAIWWNNRAYPDEEGCRRAECALEPVPGSTSALTEACRQGTTMTLAPHGSKTWNVTWEMKPHQAASPGGPDTEAGGGIPTP